METVSPNDSSGDFSATARILLVEDDRVHLEMLERCLSSMRLNFISATDGQIAVELLKAERFDIVISDIVMPHLDGIELLHLIRKEYAGTDVILITGYSQKYSFSDVIREGAIDFVEKPFTIDVIRAKIFRILKERAQLAQRRQIEKKISGRSPVILKNGFEN